MKTQYTHFQTLKYKGFPKFTDSEASLSNSVGQPQPHIEGSAQQTFISADWIGESFRGLVIAGCGDEEEVIKTESWDEGEEGTGVEKETKQVTGGYTCS